MVLDLPQPGGPETSGVTLPVCATVQKIRLGVVLQGIILLLWGKEIRVCPGARLRRGSNETPCGLAKPSN